jgi:acyl-CoA synthetase (AMP-forming)/AMP-acid ligase II
MAPITNTHNSYSLFRQAVERTPDTTAVVDLATEQRLTDRELAKRVRRVGTGYGNVGSTRVIALLCACVIAPST